LSLSTSPLPFRLVPPSSDDGATGFRCGRADGPRRDHSETVLLAIATYRRAVNPLRNSLVGRVGRSRPFLEGDIKKKLAVIASALALASSRQGTAGMTFWGSSWASSERTRTRSLIRTIGNASRAACGGRQNMKRLVFQRTAY
jgi:hypothetical protein